MPSKRFRRHVSITAPLTRAQAKYSLEAAAELQEWQAKLDEYKVRRTANACTGHRRAGGASRL